MGVYILVSTGYLKRCDFNFYNVWHSEKLRFIMFKTFEKFKILKFSKSRLFAIFIYLGNENDSWHGTECF